MHTAEKVAVNLHSENGAEKASKISFYLYEFLSMNTGRLLFVALLVALYVISRFNYLLFHTLVELVSIVIAVSIFNLAWNIRRYLDNSFLLFIGIAYLSVAGLDLLHTIGYQGMGVLNDPTANKATQLWIAARYQQSISLLAAPFFLYRKINSSYLLVAFGSISTLLLASIIFWGTFPDCYITGQGLTPFKIYSEYLIILIFLCSIGIFVNNKRKFEPAKFRWFILAIVFTILSEISFTFYVSVYGPANLAGHYFKLISFLFIYRAIVVSGLRTPYDELMKSNKRYRALLRNSTEAIYCVGLRKPLDISLPEDKQIDHFYKYGYIAEANDIWAKKIAGFENVEGILGSSLEEIMPRNNPENIAFLKELIRSNYSMKDVESVEEYKTGVKINAVNTVTGYIENGHLVRVWGTGRDITEQKLIEKDLSRFAGRLITVQEQERRRLARELHDDLSQRLAELAISAGRIKMESSYTNDSAAILDSMQQKLIKISEDVHAISRQLHPSIIEDLGLIDALTSECNNISNIHGIQVQFEHNKLQVNFPHDIAICMFRIAQEGLRNAAKHAHTDKVKVCLTRENGEILLRISDKGAGFDPKEVRHKPGLGLASMRERLRLIKGTLAINSQPGQGCEVMARIKYN